MIQLDGSQMGKMRGDSFGNLRADAHHGVERGHWFLENHGHVESAQAAKLSSVRVARFCRALEAERGRFSAYTGLRRKQTHERESQHGFPAAGFADEAQGFTAGDGEAQAVHVGEPIRGRWASRR